MKAANFNLNQREPNLGIPLYYILRVKNHQVRMLQERGYQPRPEDQVYQTLRWDQLEEHLESIKPRTLKEHMSGVYTLREDVPEKSINGRRLGRKLLVYYPELKLSKDMKKIEYEYKSTFSNLAKLRELDITQKEKVTTIIKASPLIYQDVFKEMGGRKKRSLKTFDEWEFRGDSKELVDDFIKTNHYDPEIKHAMVVSFSGVAPNYVKKLQNYDIFVRLEIFTYSDFSYVPIDHRWASQYRLLTEEEWEEIRKQKEGLSKQVIPRIKENDVFSRYYGASVGDVFEIKNKNFSPNDVLGAKYSHIEYRVVVPSSS